MKKINLKIVTPERTVYEEEILQATLPTQDGEVTILPDHYSYIAGLKPGEMYIKSDGESVFLAVSGGFIEFNDNNLVILADTAERAEEIDLERAEEARKKALEINKEEAIQDENIQYALGAKIQKELARINVAMKYRRLRGIQPRPPK